jgi:hypothetical protein
LAVACLAVFSVGAAKAALPSWEQVQKVVDQQLNSLGDYQSGDLISKNQVDPIFDRLQGLGWTVRDRLDIMALVPSDNEAMVRQFRTAAGKKFMREINKSPLGYDRVDQIEQLPGGRTLGQSTIDLLISTPGGYKNILNLGTSTPKQNQSWMLAPGSQSCNFNAATGRIYTAEALVARLKQSYQAALAGK